MGRSYKPKGTLEEQNLRKQQRFLRVLLTNNGFVERTIKECRTTRWWLNKQRAEFPDFADLFNTIIDQTNEVLEAEVYRRGFVGHDDPVIHGGKMSGKWVDAKGRICEPETEGAHFVPLTVKKYSDQLAMFFLKGRLPEKYRDLPQGKVRSDLTDAEIDEKIMEHVRKQRKAEREEDNAPVM